MNVKEEQICRLCLKVPENDFTMIDEITRNMFEVLLLQVNLDITKDPIICKDCTEVANKCFNFKSLCNNTKNITFNFDKTGAMFEWKDICKDERDIETVDHFICRFCSNHLSESNCVLLEALMDDISFAEMLHVLMPEMDFNIINNPVICTTCREDLECYIKFAKNSLDVEEKITKYFVNQGTPFSTQVKLNDVLHFLFKNSLEMDYTQIHEIKQENLLEDIGDAHSDVFDGELFKAEEELKIKDEVNLCEMACETTSGMPVFKINIPCGNQNSSFTPIMADYRKYMCESNQMLSPGNVSKTQILKCTICNYETKHKSSLKSHMLVHKDVTEVKMYKCSMCTFETKRKEGLTRHMLVHKDINEVKMYKCSTCTFETKRKECLVRHMLVHKDITDVVKYKCSMCTYETKRKEGIPKHMLVHKAVNEVKMHKCSTCTFETKRKKSLVNHMLVHKDVTEVKEVYKCTICPFETKRKGNLKNHVLTHKDITELEMYKCSMCTFETKHKASLRNHMVNHKDITEIDMYKCSMCTFETKYKRNLKCHMLSHKDVTEVEMYKCSMCTYETKHKYSLRSHLLTHRDTTEIYKCSVCTYETKQEDNLKTHMLIHKDVTEVEMYKCTTCNYEVKHNTCIKRHICKSLNICDNTSI